MNEPKYIKIKNKILGDILAGKLKPGTKLPSREQMVSQLGITHSTLEKTMRELSKTGLISSSRRTGTYIIDKKIQLKIALLVKIDNDFFSLGKVLQGILFTFMRQSGDFTYELVDSRQVLQKNTLLNKFDLIAALYPDDLLLRLLADFSRKVILINRYAADFSYISTNYKKATRDITSYFLRLTSGRKKQLFYLDTGGNGFLETQRREGFIEACRENDVFYTAVRMEAGWDNRLRQLMNMELSALSPVIMISSSSIFTGPAIFMSRQRKLTLWENFYLADYDNFYAQDHFGISIPSVLQDYQAIGTAVSDAIRQFSPALNQVFILHKFSGLPDINKTPCAKSISASRCPTKNVGRVLRAANKGK
ncbi:MAG: hypothetical protein A2096_16835 [Spirochaetes bacterium GWF1_41_5]|nr:MAG: hypothetical protein A2096_16835 [Spirochaetes bacterium GWF1_41_5]HBE02435.1 hypothetical protein [Spirochaetia bacterium]